MNNIALMHSVLITVQNSKTLVEAADKLYLSQPYLSRLIKEWEEKYNTKLVNRSHRPISLTKQGLICLAACKSMLEQHEQMVSMITNESSSFLPNIRIYLSNAYLKDDVLLWLGSYSKNHPGGIQLLLSVEQTIPQAFSQGVLQIMIGKQYQVDGTCLIQMPATLFCLAGRKGSGSIEFSSDTQAMDQAVREGLVFCGDQYFRQFIKESFYLSGWTITKTISLPSVQDVIRFLKDNPNMVALLDRRSAKQLPEEFRSIELNERILSLDNAICWSEKGLFLEDFCQSLAGFLKGQD